MNIEFNFNIKWSRFEKFLLESRNSVIGRFLWNLHSYIWKADIIERATANIKFSKSLNDEEQIHAIAQIFVNCRFKINSLGFQKKCRLIEAKVKSLSQNISSFNNPASFAVVPKPSITPVETTPPATPPKNPEESPAIKLNSTIMAVTKSQEMADIICKKIIPQKSIDKIKIENHEDGLDFEILLKSEMSTNFSDLAKKYIFESKIPRAFRYFPRTKSLLENAHIHAAKTIKSSINFKENTITFTERSIRTDFGGEFRRNLESIKFHPGNQMTLALARTVNPSEKKEYLFTPKDLQNIFGDLEWP
jgi:hypothetical protein